MAIAGIIISTPASDLAGVRAKLGELAAVCELNELTASSQLVAVLECPVQELDRELAAIAGLAGVLQVDLAYVNYEDDQDSEGNIPCPPEMLVEEHGRGKRAKAGSGHKPDDGLASKEQTSACKPGKPTQADQAG